MPEDFADMLNRLLREHDRSQVWLAKKIGVNRSTVGRWTTGVTKPASPDVVREISRAFNLNEAQTQELLIAAFPSLQRPKPPISQRTDIGQAIDSLVPPYFTEDVSPLVGREAELAQLQSCLASAQKGIANMVLVAGEAGIGKTRLVQEFLAGQLADTGLLCAAKSYPGEQAVPYLALSEALASLVSAGLVPDIDSIWLAEVAEVVSELQVARPDLRPNPAIEAEHAPARRFQGLNEFITALASEGTLVLWLDDLQWVDESSLDYLRFLLTRGRQARVLVVGTYRPEEVNADHPLAELRSVLIRENLLTEISLSPLAEQEVSQMVADLTGLDSDLWPLGRRVHREIGGIPFFITEQIKLLKEEGWLSAPQWETIPLSSRLQELIRGRFLRLDETAFQFLKVASVIGARFSFGVVSRASDLDQETALDALDRSIAAGLIRKRGASEYSFWHDQARIVLYEDLKTEVSTEHWQRWHRRVGEAIEALHPDDAQREAWLEQLAHYFCEAEIWPKALTYLLQAGQKALALFAHKSARDYFERADKLMTHAAVEPTLTQQVICAEGLGDACTHLGLFDLALPSYQRAVGLTETEDTSVTRLGWKIARVYERQAKFKLAVSWLERSLLVLDKTSEKDVEARVHWLRGLIEVRRGQPEAALTWAEEALRLSREAEEAPSAERPPTSQPWALTGLVEEAQANNLMGVVLRARGDLAEAAGHCSRSAELYEALGHQRGMATAYANLATLTFEQEQWPKAETAYKRALVVHQDTGNRYGEAMVLCNLADTYYHQGRLEEAMACVQVGLRLATETLEIPFLQVLAHETTGIICLAQGDDEAAYEHLAAGLHLAETHDIQEWLVLIQIPLAEIYLKRGRLDEARRAAEAALEQAIAQGSEAKQGVVRRMFGRIYQAQGLREQAEAELQASLGLVVDHKEQRYELARTLVALAALYVEDRTKIREGQVMLQQAITIFQELGAALDLKNAQALHQRYKSPFAPLRL